MSYWESRPDPRLAEFVEAVCFSRDEHGRAAPPMRIIPDGRIDVLLSVDAGGAGSVRVFGTKTRALWVTEPEPVENLMLRLRPGAAAALLGIDAHEITDAALPLDELLGAGSSGALLDAGDADARAVALQGALLARAGRAATRPRLDARVLAAAGRLLASAGRLRVAQLARELGFGERALERAFRRHVGVTPKTFARIARFRRAWDQLQRGGAPVEVAYARGYFDQPHLVRDFRSFAGDSPGRIFPSRGGAADPSVGA